MYGSANEDGDPITFGVVSNSLTGNDVPFKADNTFEGTCTPFVMNTHYTVNGMQFNLPVSMNSITNHAGEWTREGSLFNIKNEGSNEASQFTIVTLNATTLILTGDQDSLDIGEDFPASYEFSATFTFTR